jgi:AcrR family transcriptional regulator
MATFSPEPRTESEVAGSEARIRMAAAARDLFASQGYENTTVEAIAERAGVARRTFFRHFRSKDDAIFPDHGRIEATTAAHLAALRDVAPLIALTSGIRMVFRSYVDDPVVSVERYRLTQSFPALRDREIASVSRYTRLFGSYLRTRFGDVPGAGLRAEVVAAAYVAAHNHVLREWLRGAGDGDPTPALEAAFDWVASRLGTDAAQPGVSAAAGSGVVADGDDVVVAVFRAGESMDNVMERISRSL